MKRLLLVRHGETEWNAMRRLQGQTDIALTAAGEAQARALAPLVTSLGPDRAWTSTLSRAQQTAALLGHAGAEPISALREQALGDWEGRQIAEIRAEAPEAYLGWRAGTHTPPGAEPWADFRQRVEGALTKAFEASSETALVVCHGGVIRAALDVALGLPPSKIIPVGPASMTILAHTGREVRLEAFNLRGASVELHAPD